jgi:hypothetical protein
MWTWRKSSASYGTNDDCVEVAWDGRTVRVRDSKDRRGPTLCFGPASWTDFLATVTAVSAPGTAIGGTAASGPADA